MSKVLKRIVNNQSMEFLDKHNILYKFQLGFQKNHSTDFCLSYLTGRISKGFDSGILTEVILIDLQKAFDTIDHNISFLKISLPLPVYDVELNKDIFLDLCYFSCI